MGITAEHLSSVLRELLSDQEHKAHELVHPGLLDGVPAANALKSQDMMLGHGKEDQVSMVAEKSRMVNQEADPLNTIQDRAADAHRHKHAHDNLTGSLPQVHADGHASAHGSALLQEAARACQTDRGASVRTEEVSVAEAKVNADGKFPEPAAAPHIQMPFSGSSRYQTRCQHSQA